jgi:hypothetical protein
LSIHRKKNAASPEENRFEPCGCYLSAQGRILKVTGFAASYAPANEPLLILPEGRGSWLACDLLLSSSQT